MSRADQPDQDGGAEPRRADPQSPRPRRKVDDEALRNWVRDWLREAQEAGMRVTVHSLGHAARPTDPNFLTEWLKNEPVKPSEGAQHGKRPRRRMSRPSVEEWQAMVDHLRSGLRATGREEEAARVRMSTILLAHGLDPAELAEELKALAPYTSRPEVARVASELVELDDEELEKIEDAILYTKWRRTRRRQRPQTNKG